MRVNDAYKDMIEKIRDMLAFATPIRVIQRPETLMILDYRPTWMMLLSVTGFVVFVGLFIWLAISVGFAGDTFGLWATGLIAITCFCFAVRGSLREEYYFDNTTDCYTFVRRFVFRREVIEGAMSQFTGAQVRTHEHEEGETYSVALMQEGMFLTGVSELILREETPILNSYSNEQRIATAIGSFIVAVQVKEENRKAFPKVSS